MTVEVLEAPANWLSGIPFVDCPDRAQWLKERRLRIGGSDAPVILDVAPESWGSRYSLWADKTGVCPPNEWDTEATWLGREFEATIAAAWGKLQKRPVYSIGSTRILINPQIEWQAATLDRVIEGDEGPEIVEVKMRSEFAGREWREGAPLECLVQVQHQLSVTGLKRAHLVAFIGGRKIETITIDRDERLINEVLLPVEADFWSMVVDREPPLIDGSEETLETIKRKNLIKPKGKEIALGTAALEMLAEIHAAKDAADEAEARENAAKAALIELMGDAEFGTLPDGRAITHKMVSRRAFSVAATSYRELRTPNRPRKN